MTNKNDKGGLKDSLLEIKQMREMFEKGSENHITNLLTETTTNILKKLITEAEDDEKEAENDYTEDVVDNVEGENNDTEGIEDTDVADLDTDLENSTEDSVEGTEMSPEGLDTGEGDLDDDFDIDQFKDDNGEYDLTNASLENTIKVFKRVKGTDNVVLTDLGDGKIQMVDNETDSEYFIDTKGSENGTDVEGGIESDLDIEPKMEEGYENVDEVMVEDNDPTIEIELGSDEEGEGMIDEKNLTQSYSANRRAGVLSQTRAANAPGANKRDGSQLVRNESKEMKKLKLEYVNKMKEHETYKKQVNEEISQLNSTLQKFAKTIKESVVLNNNLGKYVKLVTENSTTKDEKVNILNRFATEGKTIEDSNKLYESISKELKGKTSLNPMKDEKPMVTENIQKKANEKVLYENKELKDIQSLMKRMF